MYSDDIHFARKNCITLGFCSTFLIPVGVNTPSAVQKSSQINIRFDPKTEAALNDTAQSLGLSKSALVRNLTEKFLEEVRKTGAVELRPQWIADMARADARTQWGDRKILNDKPATDDVPDKREAVNYPAKKQPNRNEKP
jgi:hypothetical protein